jgi:UPF0271 protein
VGEPGVLTVDLNADVGESFGPFAIGHDAGLMTSITSANVAAGFHGGDPSVLRATIRLAREHGVEVGAHPGFPDLSGFGRRNMQLSMREAEDLVLYQIAAVAGVAAAEGVSLRHVKPHGALYNMAARDRALADAVVRAVRAVDARLVVVGLSGSLLVAAALEAGLRAASEAFSDRGYLANGALAPRDVPGGVISDPALVARRAVAMVRDRQVTALDGATVALDVDTLCVHGDTPGAARLAAEVRRGLEAANIVVAAVAGG